MKNNKSKKDRLTWHNGQWRISCGYKLKDGRRIPLVMMLGKDERIAKLRADSFRQIWQVLRQVNARTGTKATWTPYFLDYAEQHFLSRMSLVENSSEVVQAFNGLASSPASPADGAELLRRAKESSFTPCSHREHGKLTLSAAVEKYREHLRQLVRTNERSHSNCNRHHVSVGVMLKRMKDEPVENIGHDQLDKLLSGLKDRSVNKLSPDTVSNYIHDTKCFYTWLEDTGRWHPTFNWMKLFKVRKSKLLTKSEKLDKVDGQKTFTPDELAQIYAVATQRQRLYLLLGLNTASTQQQLADLKRWNIDLDAEQPNIQFIRAKTVDTGIRGYYVLWPETVDVLRRELGRTPRHKDDWAFTTKDGNPLVYFKQENGSRCDPVHRSWMKLLAKAEIPEARQLGFKYLRKTISTMVLNMTLSETVQQQMLCHANGSMARKHYTGKLDPSHYAALTDTLKRIRCEVLWKMFGLPDPKGTTTATATEQPQPVAMATAA